jgi:hypothetical protein
MKMKMNLKLVGLTLMMGLLTLQLSAQGGQRPGGRPGGPGRGFQMSEEDVKRRVNDLSENLKLSEDQHKKILDYELEFYTKMQVEREKIRNSGEFDREAMRDRMMKVREERDKKYEEVLSPSQMEKYRELREQRMNQRRQQFQENNSQNSGERPARGRGRN